MMPTAQNYVEALRNRANDALKPDDNITLRNYIRYFTTLSYLQDIHEVLAPQDFVVSEETKIIFSSYRSLLQDVLASAEFLKLEGRTDKFLPLVDQLIEALEAWMPSKDPSLELLKIAGTDTPKIDQLGVFYQGARQFLLEDVER